MPDLSTLFHSRQQTTDRIEWLIASTRVVLVGFWLLAAYFDPFEEPRYSENVGALLAVYFAFAVLVAALAFAGVTDAIWHALVHATDIGLISILLYFTQGALSPFFLFISFVMFAATLRWSWRGAALTAALLLIATGLLAWDTWTASDKLAQADPEWNRVLLRFGFLVMSGMMLMWFGYTNEATSRRLARLAEWPSPASDEVARTADRPLEAMLAHIAEVMEARSVSVWCRWKDSLEVETWRWTSGSLQYDRSQAGEQPPSIDDGAPRINPPRALADQKRSRRREGLSAAFANDIASGGIALPGRMARSTDDTAMMEIIASRVLLELEHQQLREEHELYAALQERARLARDLHDGVLQTLTASRLQLSEITSNAGADVQAISRNISRILQDEQRRLREFGRQLLTPPPSSGETALQHLLSEIAERQQKLWQCSIATESSPPGAGIPSSLGAELSFMIGEAIGNAVRHGKATDVRIGIVRESDSLLVSVGDNGRGLPGPQGEFTHADLLASGIGPSSLIARISNLNGAMALSTSPRGVVLRMMFPL